MANRNNNKAITLKPNADGKLVVDIGSLNIDPGHDYTFKRTTTETFTLSKSAKSKSRAKYSDDYSEDSSSDLEESSYRSNKGKYKNTGRPRPKSASKPKQVTFTSSSISRSSKSALPSTIEFLFKELIWQLEYRAIDEDSRPQHRIWTGFADEVREIKREWGRLGDLEPHFVRTLTRDLQELLSEAKLSVTRGLSRAQVERETAVHRQWERLEKMIKEVKEDVGRAVKD